MTIRAVLLAIFVLAACGAPADVDADSAGAAPAIEGSLFDAAPTRQWRLPLELREISGMAATPDGRLFAHDDERAVIFELDAATGRIVKRFGVGAPEAGDFEGLAIDSEGAFWVTTSTGALLRFREGANGARVGFERFDAGLGGTCEIEGLAFLAATESLILACKHNEARGMGETIVLYQWRPGAGAQLWRSLAEREVTQAAGVRHFRPSAVEIDPLSGRTLILSARDGAWAELDPDGALRSARALAREHGQAESMAVLADGALAVADEGGDGRALLSVYDRGP